MLTLSLRYSMAELLQLLQAQVSQTGLLGIQLSLQIAHSHISCACTNSVLCLAPKGWIRQVCPWGPWEALSQTVANTVEVATVCWSSRRPAGMRTLNETCSSLSLDFKEAPWKQPQLITYVVESCKWYKALSVSSPGGKVVKHFTVHYCSY